MEMIIVGVFNENDKVRLEEKLPANLKIYWDHEQYNLECREGIRQMEQHYDLHSTGAIVDANWNDFFASSNLLQEIEDTFMGVQKAPRFFKFIDNISNSNIKKIILAFADEWNYNDLVIVKKIDFNSVKSQVNFISSWKLDLLDFNKNTITENDEYPLILVVEKDSVPY